MRPATLALVLILASVHAASAQTVIYRPWGLRPITPAVAPVGPAYNYGFGSAYSPWGYGSPWSYPYTGSILFPGFGATETPRMRPTLYPAIPLPPREVIAAKLAGDDDDRATLILTLPRADAQVWMDGKLMSQSGTRRRFLTPSLNPDKQYVLEVQVRWVDEAGPQTRTRKVSVSAGDSRDVIIR